MEDARKTMALQRAGRLCPDCAGDVFSTRGPNHAGYVIGLVVSIILTIGFLPMGLIVPVVLTLWAREAGRGGENTCHECGAKWPTNREYFMSAPGGASVGKTALKTVAIFGGVLGTIIILMTIYLIVGRITG